MEITLSGKSIDINEISYNAGMGFGKPVPRPLIWELRMDTGEFLTLMKPVYDEMIADFKKDDEVTGEFNPPYPGAKDYPELEKFVRDEFESFADFFITFLSFEFVSLVFSYSEERKYAVNNIDGMQRIENTIHIKGQAHAPRGHSPSFPI